MTRPPNNDLGKMLRRKRVRAALSLDDLAERAGMSKSFLSLIETRGAKMSQTTAWKLAIVLGMDGQELAAGYWLRRVPKDLWPALYKLLAAQLDAAIHAEVAEALSA